MSDWKPLTKAEYQAAPASELFSAFLRLRRKANSIGLDLGQVHLGDTNYFRFVRMVVEHEAIEGTKASCEELFKLWASGKE